MTSIYFIFDYLSAFSKKAGQNLLLFQKNATEEDLPTTIQPSHSILSFPYHKSNTL